MSAEWGSLPLLSLNCVLKHLNTKDALAAMSICRHWRNATLLFEGHKDMLKLKVDQFERNLFLTRLFKKHTKRLHIYLECNLQELENFMKYILSQYFETRMLQELVFIGPSFSQCNRRLQHETTQLKRIITETLVFKHAHCLQYLCLLGCEIEAMKNENDRYSHKLVEYYSRPLVFSKGYSPANLILSSCNAALFNFPALQHIALDYEQLSSAALHTLRQLAHLSRLSLTVGMRPGPLPRLQWPHNLEVTIVIVAVPYRRFAEIMDTVFTEDLPLISLKVLFCQTLYSPLINHVVNRYKLTLQELVWADAPLDSTDDALRIVQPMTNGRMEETYNVSPLILLCWQCTHLRRLVIHGYWIWVYELVGLVRLRKSLESLEVSAAYEWPESFGANGSLTRVFELDTAQEATAAALQQVNEFTSYRWAPIPWSQLHPGLRAYSTPSQRGRYVLHELRLQ